MTPVLNRNQAKDSGFAQVRDAILRIEGDVDSVTFDTWGGKLVDDDGKPVPPKEFCEVKLLNCKVLESSEELSMEIDGKDFSFRVNCSDFKGSFWVDLFLASADANKVIIPDGLLHKRVIFKKATLVAKKDPKFNKTAFIIEKVGEISKDGTAAPVPAATATSAPATAPAAFDPIALACDLADGKTEAMFRSTISLEPRMVGNPMLSLVKSGALTEALVKDGLLTTVKDGDKTIYRKVKK